MPVEAAIILAVSVLALLIIAVWLITQGTKPRLPKGEEKQMTAYGHTVIVRWAESSLPPPAGMHRNVSDTLLRHCLHAVEAAASSWDSYWKNNESTDPLREVNAREKLRTVRVMIMPSWMYDELDGGGTYADKTAAMQVYTPQLIGSGPPLIYIREIHVANSLGSLVIHECMHALMRGDNMHHDPRVWLGQESIENRAFQKWKNTIGR